jgi:hypothetical protein
MHSAAQCTAPAFRSCRRLLESQVREYRRTIDVTGDLLGATLRGDVLCAYQLRAPTLAGEIEQVIGDKRNRPPGALLPRCVGGRVDDDLPDDSPARVVGVATGDEKSRQRLGHAERTRLRPVAVEMPQGGPHAAAVLNRRGELTRSPPRLMGCNFDASTVLHGGLRPPVAGIGGGKLR